MSPDQALDTMAPDRGRIVGGGLLLPFRHHRTRDRYRFTSWLLAGVSLLVLALVNVIIPSAHHVAFAHTENSTGYSAIAFDDDQVRYTLKLDYFELARIVVLKAEPGDSLGTLRSALDANSAGVNAYLESKLHLFTDGVRCNGSVTDTDVEQALGRDYAVIHLAYDCPGVDAGNLLIRFDVFFDDNDVSHRNIVNYTLAGSTGTFIFSAEDRELHAGEDHLLGRVARFVTLGFAHILAGMDHILFIVALLLGSRSLGSLLKIASAFTAAHSVTLVLTALGWLSLPSQIIEPLIALSITYVAIENLVMPKASSRLAVVFGFGLLHGMGFASALQFSGDGGWLMLLSLVTFNIGIEVGQALIILTVFPALLLVRRVQWASVAQGLATSIVSVVGLVWFVERLAG